MFAKIENNQVAEYPLTEGAIKLRFPLTSFTTNFSANLPDGYVRVQPSSQPSQDELKVITETTPVLVDGVWTQAWVQFDKYTAEELAAYNAKKDSDKAQEVRDVRNKLLSRTDWRFRSDMTPSQAWIDYCVALRNVPEQTGFPWAVEWPTEPQ